MKKLLIAISILSIMFMAAGCGKTVGDDKSVNNHYTVAPDTNNWSNGKGELRKPFIHTETTIKNVIADIGDATMLANGKAAVFTNDGDWDIVDIDDEKINFAGNFATKAELDTFAATMPKKDKNNYAIVNGNYYYYYHEDIGFQPAEFVYGGLVSEAPAPLIGLEYYVTNGASGDRPSEQAGLLKEFGDVAKGTMVYFNGDIYSIGYVPLPSNWREDWADYVQVNDDDSLPPSDTDYDVDEQELPFEEDSWIGWLQIS